MKGDFLKVRLLELCLDFSGDLDRWSECLGSECPLRRTCRPWVCFHELESGDLADEFLRVATERAACHLDTTTDSVWIDDEGSTSSDTRLLVEDVIESCDLSGVVSEHEIWEVLHEAFVLDPCAVREDSICTHGEDSDSHLVELSLRFCHILQLRRTDEGEVSRIVEQYCPLPLHISEGDIGRIILDRIVRGQVPSRCWGIDFYLRVEV